MATRFQISEEREALFQKAVEELQHRIQVYHLNDRFDLPPEYEGILAIDASKVPGCHYSVDNVFARIIRRLEEQGVKIGDKYIQVTPENTILFESSSGNAWVAFVNAARKLGYECRVIMPDGLPEPRYQHPDGSKIDIIRTPKEEYVLGMPKKMKELVIQNRQRLAEGKKIFVSPNHSIYGADITVKAMGTMIDQLVEEYDGLVDKLFVSMGNGASACGLGESVKAKFPTAKVYVTESFAYGGGWDKFAKRKGLPSYLELYGIEPGSLMAHFKEIGTNAPIGIELPLQERALKIIDEYVLITNQDVLNAFKQTHPSLEKLERVHKLPKWDNAPAILYLNYGNSSLGNIMAAVHNLKPGETCAVTIYDGRSNY